MRSLLAAFGLLAAVAHPAGAADRVVEFYNGILDHYFITANVVEAAAIDGGSAGPGWSRTGASFLAGGGTPVCRFYGSTSPGPNSHFYTADAQECASLKQLQITLPPGAKRWNFESLDFQTTPATNGGCPSGLSPVYRAYNNGFALGKDSNHRITASKAGYDEVVARGWIGEGVVLCAPIDVLRYADKVYALWTSAYPFAVTKTGVARVVNKTRFSGPAALTDCWLAEAPLDDGKVLANCQESASSIRYVFYIDPTSNELYEYADALPSGIVWLDQSPYDPVRPEWKARVRVSDGWYVVLAGSEWTISFEDDATGALTVVNPGSSAADGAVRLLISYSH